MYRTWTDSAQSPELLAAALEAHLNEFAQEVVSVAYAVTDEHHVLAVYRTIDFSEEAREEAAVSVAELIVEQAQS